MRYLHFILFVAILIPTHAFAEKVSEGSNEGKTASAKVIKKAVENPENKANKESKNDSAQTRLATVDITGVDSELKKNIELHMPVTVPECLADRAEVRQFFSTVKKHLRKASRALGYYDSEFVSGGSIESGCWRLRLRIKPGLPTKVIMQTIKVVGPGKQEKEFLTLLENPPYEIGEALNHQKYSDYKTKLSEVSQILGYFDAEFEQHNIRVDPISRQATVFLVLNTGSRYRYGDITVDQNVLTDKAINKYLILQKGEPYKAEDIILQQQSLQRSGYFKTIKIDALTEQAKNKHIPVQISLTRKKRNAYKFKVGFGSDTGARVSAEMNRRWTGSKGRQLKIKGQYAQTLSGVSLQLVNPRKKPDDNSLVYNIDWTKDSNDDVVSRSVNVGAKLIRKRQNDWVQSATIGFLDDTTQVDGEAETKSKLLLFGVGLEKVKADSLIFPTDGWRLKLALSAASEAVLSDQNVFQIKAQGKLVKPFGKGKLLTRMNIGSTIVSDFDRLPKSLRFFAGGSNSVRGYAFESLGEVNASNSVIGGKQLLDLSLEYQHSINESWSAAAFIDAGDAFDSWDDVGLKVGVGFGARWKSPVGPVRIDIGFPRDDFQDPSLHLSVGSDL